MLLEGGGETVGPVKIRTCTEIVIIVLLRIQDGIYARLRRDIDRSRGQSLILVGIVRGIHSEVLLQNTVQRIIVAESYRYDVI